jgi:outer membrane protein assembly factor BamB
LPDEGFLFATLLAGEEDSVLLHLFDTESPSALVNVGAESGEVRWRVDDIGVTPITSDIQLVDSSSPVVVISAYDVDANTELIALDAATGQERWRSATIQEVAAADTSRIYGPMANADGTGGFGALDPATGTLLWSVPITGAGDPQGTIGASGLLADGLLVATLASPHEGSAARAVAVAIDADTGNLIWRADYPEYEALILDHAAAGAVFVTGVEGSNATLLALDTD